VLQLVFVSSINPSTGGVDPAPILVAARRNNPRHAVSGILYSDGARFLELLEGPEEGVEAVLKRVRRDKRHCEMQVLLRREVPERQFGEEPLAHRTPGKDGEAFIARVAKLLAGADPEARAGLHYFEVRRAA